MAAMGIERGPRLVTRGQETVIRQEREKGTGDELGLQSSFFDPGETCAGVDLAGERIQKHSAGVQLALDWCSVSFTPPAGDVEPGEFQPGDELLPHPYLVDQLRRVNSPAAMARFDAKVEQTIMVERERRLRAEVQLALSVMLGCSVDDWVDLEYGSRGYQSAIQGPDGARIDFDAKGRYDFNVQLPGKAVRRIGAKGMVKWFRFALYHGGKARRIDSVVDDFSRTISPTQVMAAIQSPVVVTKAKSGVRMDGFETHTGKVTGETIYLGANSSRRKLRVYDKGLESDGEIDCIRWEMQERDEAAETLMVELAYEPWEIVIRRRLVSFVDFRDSESHSEVEKRERLEWFQAFVGLIERANVYLAQAVGTVKEKIAWIDRCVGPTLAVVMEAWKGDLGPLMDIIVDGRRRWKPRHKAVLLADGGVV